MKNEPTGFTRRLCENFDQVVQPFIILTIAHVIRAIQILTCLGLEFRISNTKDETDCVVEPINNEFESSTKNLKRFILEHAKLLLNFDPSFVNYWGKVSA